MTLTLTKPLNGDPFSDQLLNIDGFIDWLSEFGGLDIVYPFVGYLHAEGYEWSALRLWEGFIVENPGVIAVRIDGDDTVYLHIEYVGQEDELARIPTADRLGWLTGICPSMYSAALTMLLDLSDEWGPDLSRLNTVAQSLPPCHCRED